MQVYKRNGAKVLFVADKINARINKFTYGLDASRLDIDAVVKQTLKLVKDNMRTQDIDEVVCEILEKEAREKHCSDYGVLYVRLKMSNLHKQTKKRFFDVIEQIRQAENKRADDEKTINDEDYLFIEKNQSMLDSAVISHRDYEYTMDQVETLEPQLYRIDGQIIERPSHFAMRRAIECYDNLDQVIEQYDRLTKSYKARSNEEVEAYH